MLMWYSRDLDEFKSDDGVLLGQSKYARQNVSSFRRYEQYTHSREETSFTE
jgi:hypothetical protein